MGFARKKQFGHLIRLDNRPNARVDGKINPIYLSDIANQVWNYTINTLQTWIEGEEKLGHPVWRISVRPDGIIYELECDVLPAFDSLAWFTDSFAQGLTRRKVTDALEIQGNAWAREDYEHTIVVDEQATQPQRIKSLM